MNQLDLPHWIFRGYRRDVYAFVFRFARKLGRAANARVFHAQYSNNFPVHPRWLGESEMIQRLRRQRRTIAMLEEQLDDQHLYYKELKEERDRLSNLCVAMRRSYRRRLNRGRVECQSEPMWEPRRHRL